MTNSQWIFPPVTPLQETIRVAEARRVDPNDKLAHHYAGGDVYKRVYRDALRRLSLRDMLTLDQAAARLSVTPDDYVKMAEAGKAILIRIEAKNVVPAWTITADGRVDDLKLDIAREFAVEGKSYFKFLDYLKFMTEDTASITATLPKDTLKNMFRRAGLQEYRCSATISATMNQLADQRTKKPEFWGILIQHLDSALTWGGWDPQGGLSRYFRDKYSIPGMTIEEQYAEAIKNQPRP